MQITGEQEIISVEPSNETTLYACGGCGVAAPANAFPDGPEQVCTSCKAEGRRALIEGSWRLPTRLVATAEGTAAHPQPDDLPRKRPSQRPDPTGAEQSIGTKRRGPRAGDSRMVEAGRKGGLATRAKVGVDHYKAIGRQGGKALAEARGTEFFREIGRKGRGERSRLNAEVVGPLSAAGDAVSVAPEMGQAPPTSLPEWLKSPISLDACAHSLGVPLTQLVKAAKGGRLLAVERGNHWFTDQGVWTEYRDTIVRRRGRESG